MQAIEVSLIRSSKQTISIEINPRNKLKMELELYIMDENAIVLKRDIFDEPKVDIDVSNWKSGWYRIELFYEGYLQYYNHIRKL